MAHGDSSEPTFVTPVDTGFEDEEDQSQPLALSPQEARELRQRLDGIAAARVRAQQKLRSAYIH
jgi:hypothetical protein